MIGFCQEQKCKKAHFLDFLSADKRITGQGAAPIVIHIMTTPRKRSVSLSDNKQRNISSIKVDRRLKWPTRAPLTRFLLVAISQSFRNGEHGASAFYEPLKKKKRRPIDWPEQSPAVETNCNGAHQKKPQMSRPISRAHRAADTDLNGSQTRPFRIRSIPHA